MESNIYIFWHIATINNWRHVVNEQYGRLVTSGLLNKAKLVIVGVVGSEEVNFYNDKIVTFNGPLERHEVHTMEIMDNLVKSNTFLDHDKILYFHTKGVSRHDHQSQINVSFWRRYMEHFVIDRWIECIQWLDHVDACGVEIDHCHTAVHFAGNFWWSNVNYLKTLSSCNHLDPMVDRQGVELRIGRSNRSMKLHCLFKSRRNLYLQWMTEPEYFNKPFLEYGQ